MEQYISKDAFVAKIVDWRDKIKKGIFFIPLTGSDRANATFEYEILGKVKDLIDTIEVKEVDLDKEMNEALDHLTDKDMRGWFSYFFELGLRTQKGE